MASARFLSLAVAALLPGAAIASEPAPQPAMPSEHRLTPDEIEAVLADAARKRDGAGAPGVAAVPESKTPSIPIHGEFGISVGTDGYRAAHGTAVIGLPGSGSAVISLGTQRLPDYPDYYWYPGW